MSESDFFRVQTVDVARLFGVEQNAIVFEITVPESEESLLFWMYDAEAYAFIRKLTDVLFDATIEEVDPPRSGVGSPEASAG